MEDPGFNDGELPVGRHGALTRITRFDVETGSPDARYAYTLDAVSAGPGGDHGLSDLVVLDGENFLAVERGYGIRVSCRVYRVSVGDATDISGIRSLVKVRVTAMTKTLLADLSATPGLSPLDNIEGITLGPMPPDGGQSVVLVSDDNFSPNTSRSFWLLRCRDEKSTQHAYGRGQRLSVRAIKLFQVRIDGGRAVGPYLLQRPDSRGGDADEDGARIVGIGRPGDQAGVLETTYLGGQGRLRAVVEGRQVGNSGGALLLDSRQQSRLGGRQPELCTLGGQAVETGHHVQQVRP